MSSRSSRATSVINLVNDCDEFGVNAVSVQSSSKQSNCVMIVESKDEANAASVKKEKRTSQIAFWDDLYDEIEEEEKIESKSNQNVKSEKSSRKRRSHHGKITAKKERSVKREKRGPRRRYARKASKNALYCIVDSSDEENKSELDAYVPSDPDPEIMEEEENDSEDEVAGQVAGAVNDLIERPINDEMPPLEADPFQDENIKVKGIEFAEEPSKEPKAEISGNHLDNEQFKKPEARKKDQENDEEAAQIVIEYKPNSDIVRFSDGRECKMKPHPARVVVSSAFLGTPAPRYELERVSRVLYPAFQNGSLSSLQHEGICRTIRAWWGHGCLNSGWRKGFLLGDQTGMGKGRQIAACIAHNWYEKGVRKVIWLSKIPDLLYDARRDFAAIGVNIPLVCAKEVRRKKNKILLSEGVIFMSYTYLANEHMKKAERIIDWIGGEDAVGTIVFDECHSLKNFISGKSKRKKVSKLPKSFEKLIRSENKLVLQAINDGKGTNTGIAGFLIQHCLKKTCILYASATSFSTVDNIAPMSRLGLWGQNHHFFKTFDKFRAAIKPRNGDRATQKHPGEIPMMEIVGRDLYARGLYVARMLSYEQVEFSIEDIQLTESIRDSYNRAVGLQWTVYDAIQKAKEEIERITLKKAKFGITFWGMNQRFFKSITCAAKLQHAVAHAKNLLERGFSVGISLWGTGEARTRGAFSDFEMTESRETINIAAEMVRGFIRKNFNEKKFLNREIKRLMRRYRKELLEKVDDAKLQGFYNPLDYLKAKLGGSQKVAELTGRQMHWVSHPKGQVWTKRKKMSGGSGVNIREARSFQSGEKLVSIISAAASTGISLHCSKKNPEAGRRPRINIILELPWAADQALQQMGRFHRTNQAHPPKFVILVTTLGGERRFVSAVTKRLESLGALTRGDRTASFAGGDQVNGKSIWEGMNWENKYGSQSLRLLGQSLDYKVRQGCGWWATLRNRDEIKDRMDSKNLQEDEKARELLGGAHASSIIFPCVEDGKVSSLKDLNVSYEFKRFLTIDQFDKIQEALDAPVLNAGSQIEILNERLKDILKIFVNEGLEGSVIFGSFTKFANRILNLPVKWQDWIFDGFIRLYKETVDEAVQNGTYVTGVQDMKALGAKSVSFVGRKQIRESSLDKSRTELVQLRADYGLTFKKAEQLLEKRKIWLGEKKRERLRNRAELPTQAMYDEQETKDPNDLSDFIVDDSYQYKYGLDEDDVNEMETKFERDEHGSFDGFYSWVPGKKLSDPQQRREVVLFLEILPLGKQLTRPKAPEERYRSRKSTQFRVFFPHKPPSKTFYPFSGHNKNLNLDSLMVAFRRNNLKPFRSKHKVERHPIDVKNRDKVKALWQRQFVQAGTQRSMVEKERRCAQCANCRAVKGSYPCTGIWKRRIVTHHLLMGNIMQIWEEVLFSLADRKTSSKETLKVLRNRTSEGVFVGLDIPADCIRKLENVVKDRSIMFPDAHHGTMVDKETPAGLRIRNANLPLTPQIRQKIANDILTSRLGHIL
eukprot:CAMPEP_0167742534 /NCGR_PEP_ID=MMETSP0110_2-20121227/1488_1 /TAXON_ID=629695 /ORGANISM="Gymnochlora sp., Strain CCMP2014" /LENGTH=1509 /DNA_ID=CAMNT_0007626753 /DNA_START=128 /DNA_END=4660 /DNA_ORIENTATION=-